MHVAGGQVAQRPAAVVVVFYALRAPGRRRGRRRVAPARLDLGLLVGADHQVTRVQQLALPAALVEVQHGTGLLREARVARKDPRSVLPGADRVLGQPARDRRGRRLADGTLDHQSVQLSAREPRQGNAQLRRQLTRDRLDVGDLLRGENGAGDPTALDPQDQPAARVGSDFASARQPPGCCRAWRRSPRCSAHRPRTAPAWPAAQPCAEACSTPPAAQAHAAPRRSTRSRRAGGPSPTTTPSPRHSFCQPDRNSGWDH